MRQSEAMEFLEAQPVPRNKWWDLCKGDKRLTPVFTTGMGYQVELKESTPESKEEESE